VSIVDIGAVCFGIVVGFIVYRTLRRKTEATSLSDIASVIAAIGGGWVTAQFTSPEVFAWYCIGVFFGFFAYLVLGNTVFKQSTWLGGD
jgi:hypothetical protein